MVKRKRELERLEGDASSLADTPLADSGLAENRLCKVRRVGRASSQSEPSEPSEPFERPSSQPESSEDGYSDPMILEHGLGGPRRRYQLSHIKPGQLAFPRSAYEGYEPPLPVISESEALREFKASVDKQRAQADEKPEYDFVVLESFSAYRHPRDARRPGELAGLEKAEVDRGAKDGLMFDGILRLGETRRYVQGVPFKTMTVEGYGDEAVTDLCDRICIQSKEAKRSNIWYQLERPSKEYARFYERFLWLAEFTKHFVDYLLEIENVALDDFRFCFHGWLIARHDNDTHFQRWLKTCDLRDFRTTIAAHYNYLWKECSGVEARLLKHPIWREVHPRNLEAVKEHPNKEKKTIVTPFVHSVFKKMYFNRQFNSRDVADPAILQKVNRAKSELRLAPFGVGKTHAMPTPLTQRNSPAIVSTQAINKGDVVCFDADTKSGWKSASSVWYAYVQEVHHNEETDSRALEVLWLYEPHDTTMGAATYPFENELFLSDNCSCGPDAIDAQDVRGMINDISWFSKDPTAETGHFVRQKFRTTHEEGTDDFVSLHPSDFKCRCGEQLSDFEDCRMKYDIGDTVLVKTHETEDQEARLEPALILDFDLRTEHVVLRQLWRTSEMSNELVLTDVIVTVPASHLIRTCNVRFFERDTVAAGLPTGYDRGGAGDFYYIVHDTYEYSRASRIMTEGVDLVAPPPFRTLTGMGIFCGGGNLDRGLEEGGTVDFQYAVDWAQRAIHTYRANSREPEKSHYFLGSVNDYLARAMKGDEETVIATPGSIDLISAGSPCPGFSNMQPDKASDESLRNASMVASVVSYVDFFCPRYCILENVVAMTAPTGTDKNQNVFAQIIASFVAMGYQVQQFLADAWSHGSPQSRARVFIVASAPGIESFPLPRITHDHPRKDFPLHALGKASNGRSFGLRRNEYTPFRCTTAADAVADLPDMGDGQSRICPAFPDHCVPSEQDADARERIACVPYRPYGLGLANAIEQGVLGKPREWLQRASSVKRGLGSRAYSRVRPDALFPTVTTEQKLACGFTGRTLHWSESRPLTVMELRRAMGFPDEEPIIGSARQQVIIIGNSVDRKVSFALGLSLRESWSMSSASRLPQRGGLATLASPMDTEEEDAVGVKAQGRQGDFPNSFSDMRRAGASAVAGLDATERVALQVDATEAGARPDSGGMVD